MLDHSLYLRYGCRYISILGCWVIRLLNWFGSRTKAHQNKQRFISVDKDRVIMNNKTN